MWPVEKASVARFTIRVAVSLLALVLLGVALLSQAGKFLVVNDPRPSDVMLVLAGDDIEQRYAHAVDLLHQGYAHYIVLDIEAGRNRWGVTDAQLAIPVLERITPGQSSICAVTADSTFGETEDSARCLTRLNPKSVLLVTSDYHTRRASQIYRKRLPQYQWSDAATPNRYHFATDWWTKRAWAKTTFEEWEKLLFWDLFDRWRAKPIATG